jgi:hypothetical protein
MLVGCCLQYTARDAANEQQGWKAGGEWGSLWRRDAACAPLTAVVRLVVCVRTAVGVSRACVLSSDRSPVSQLVCVTNPKPYTRAVAVVGS